MLRKMNSLFKSAFYLLHAASHDSHHLSTSATVDTCDAALLLPHLPGRLNGQYLNISPQQIKNFKLF